VEVIMLDLNIAPGTYSLIAVDPERGDVGCAVQSRAFPVGAIVPWVRAGVGAVATQSNANIAYGPHGLDLLAQGLSPEEVVETLTREDDLREQRQVAVLNLQGDSARWSGAEVNPWHGTRHGSGYSCQGNLLTGSAVIDRMTEAFEAAVDSDLAERLLLSLEAAEAAGGDIRGSQSAALLVARWNGEGEPPAGYLYDLRVDEHRDPVRELRRIFNVKRAYTHAHRARTLAREGGEGAEEELAAALALAPDDDYLHVLAAEVCYRQGDRECALRCFRRALDLNPKARCYLTLFAADQLYDPAFAQELGS
jgi:uncharacterized Ntn-hydrolase superfamily protein